jgi:gamma-glutamyltranspeptidase/glutathione hydrolase
MVIGTPGGSHIPTGVLQVMLNMIDHGMTVTEATDAPRIHAQWMPDVLFHEPNALSLDTRALLAARGHMLEQMDYWNQIAVILVGGPAIGKPQIGKAQLYGAIDPRLPVGSVAGY